MSIQRYTPPGPVAKKYILSDAFIAGICGPIGSGKSVASVIKLIKNFENQRRLSDGWKRRRTAIVRNTYRELKSTTIKTWHQWVPAHIGSYVESGAPTHTITDEANKTSWEVMFLALDRPDDIRKLLSMELSDAWINEAREIPKAVLDGLTGRVGRFPRHNDGGCTDPQIIMDTNPPDSDHWWYKLAEDMPEEMALANAELEDQLRSIGALRSNQSLMQFFRQPSGLADNAENISNLQPGYYLKAMAGKSEDWIKVYVRGEYGFVLDGKAVYPEYKDSIHCRDFAAHPRLGLYIGMDFGLTPAAIFAQRMPNGQLRKHSEIVTDNTGIVRFAELVKTHLTTNYPGFHIAGMTGDPAGNIRNDDERTTFDLLKAAGLDVRPCSTNDPTLRIESVRDAMRRMIDGEPGMLIHPQCRQLRKAYAGGYHYKRVQLSGADRFRDEPDKNLFSHIADADQYLCLSMGEGKAITQNPLISQTNRPAYAINDY